MKSIYPRTKGIQHLLDSDTIYGQEDGLPLHGPLNLHLRYHRVWKEAHMAQA